MEKPRREKVSNRCILNRPDPSDTIEKLMADRIPSDAPNPAPLLVVGSVAFDNVITPFG